MEKWVLIFFPCPECEEGSIFAVINKKDNKLCVYCEECGAIWKIPEDIERQLYFTDWKDNFEWGGYATFEEVKAFGWGKYIREF